MDLRMAHHLSLQKRKQNEPLGNTREGRKLGFQETAELNGSHLKAPLRNLKKY
jgi:hypothetical protein